MELKMQSMGVPCMEPVLRQTQNQEQTQELRLSDGFPDVGRVLAAWAQPVLRGKEWRTGSVSASGGMLVWVLYAPEDGSGEKWLDSWIPFQMKWEVPEDKPDGFLRLGMEPRFVDARSVSPRKLMVRCGLAWTAEAYVPMELQVEQAISPPPDVRLLNESVPLRLPREAGEKTFVLDEELKLPQTEAKPRVLVAYSLRPWATEKKVLTNKILFRGSGRLHLMYQGEDEKLHSWDGEVPFSQYADLEGEYGPDAQADLSLTVTSLEPELDEEGRVRLKGGVVAQYLITDRQNLELLRDAYSPGREVTVERSQLEYPGLLDESQRELSLEQTLPGEAGSIVDVRVLPDQPRQRWTEDELRLENSAAVQVLYYGEDGSLRSSTGRWEGENTLRADPSCKVETTVSLASPPQAVPEGDGIRVRGELSQVQKTYAGQGIPMVTGITLGELQKPDPNRPSLVLCRRGSRSLWDLAKENGSTVEAIRRANHLSEEPPEQQLLLIPIV